MLEIRVDTFKAEDGISAPSFPNGITVTGVVTASSLQTNVASLNVGSNINLGNAGIITATSYRGDGSQLTGIDATTIKDSGGNVRVTGTPTGVVVSGICTATSFSGDGSALTGTGVQGSTSVNTTGIGTFSAIVSDTALSHRNMIINGPMLVANVKIRQEQPIIMEDVIDLNF